MAKTGSARTPRSEFGTFLIAFIRGYTHSPTHTSTRAYLGVLLSTRHIIVTSLSFPVTLLPANGVHHDVFVLLSAHTTNSEDPTVTLRKRQDWGLPVPKLSIRCALYRKQEKIRAEAMVEYVCAASASLSCLLLAWYTYRSTSYCSTTDDEVL